MTPYSNEEIVALLKSYCNNECDPRQAAEAEEWLLANIDSHDADAVFEQLLSEITITTDAAAKRRARERLNEFVEQKRIAPHKSSAGFWRMFTMVAQAVAIVVLLCTSIYLYRRTSDTQSMVEEYASYGETRQIVLPDGSKMWLRADSRVIYPQEFGNKIRRVYVSGEVFAEVSKDPDRPFIIESNKASVRVLGTTFDFKSYRDAYNVELSLLEGSVALTVVTEAAEQLEYLLRPGEMICVDRLSGDAKRYNFNSDEYYSWKDRPMLHFMNKPLSEIVDELQRNFDVRIVIQDESLRSVRYLASFVNGESLEQILDILNADKKMKITYQNDIIMLSKRVEHRLKR